MNWYKKSQVLEKSQFSARPLHEKGGYPEAVRREKTLYDAIKKIAEIFNIGPIEEPGIDSAGNIVMKQKINQSTQEYMNAKTIPKDFFTIVFDYVKPLDCSDRWIRMNHFVWEKFLGDYGFLPKKIMTEKEFLEDISR